MRRGFYVLTLMVATLSSAVADNAEDHTRACVDPAQKQICDASKSDFKKWFPRAYKGDYQGQRNVAFCLYDGCDGSVMQNKPLSCAWRMVILLSGSNQVDATDQNSFRLACGKLDTAEMITAKAQAERLRGQIRTGSRR